MKKSFLVLAAAALLGLAACGGGNTSGGGGGGTTPGGDTPTIDVPEGKVAFYFEMGETTPTFSSWTAVYLTGTFNSWATAPDAVVRLQKLGDTKIWYGYYDTTAEQLKAAYDSWDQTGDHPYAYQLTLGYTADSGAPGAGVDWTFKSNLCAPYAYGTNPEFVIEEGGKINLKALALNEDGTQVEDGTLTNVHSWEKQPNEPVKVTNVTLAYELAEAVPTWVDLYIPGINGAWDATNKMTPDADRKVFTFVIAETVPGVVEFKIVAEYAGVTALTWGHEILKGESGNAAVQILQADTDGIIKLKDELNEGAAFEVDFSDFVDPALQTKVELTLGVEFPSVLDTTVNPDWYVIGDFNGWSASDDYKMTVAEDNLSMSVTFEAVTGKIQFGICNNGSWDTCLKVNDANIEVTVGEEDMEVVYVVATDDMEKVNNVKAGTVNVTVKGEATGNDGSEEHPFTVAEALAKIDELFPTEGGKTEELYYVTGTVTEDEVKTGKSGDYQFYLTDGTNKLLVYYASPNECAKPQATDLVVVQGPLQKYVKGETVTPEMSSGSKLISVTPANA